MTPTPSRRSRTPARVAVQVNDEDAVAAGVDLQESDAGAPWIETGGLGVLDRG